MNTEAAGLDPGKPERVMPDSQILIVDDTPNNLKLFHSLLSEKGYKVRLATNGEMALNSVNMDKPDLILLDIMMPGIDGYEVCHRLKQNSSTRDIPIIFLSALRDEVDVVKGFDAGGLDFITKPYSSEILLARISTHLNLSWLRRQLRKDNKDLEGMVEKRTMDLEESETRLRHALDASNEGIMDWNLATDVIFFSEKFFTMLGYSANSHPHTLQSWMDLVHPEDRDDFNRKVRNIRLTNSIAHGNEYGFPKVDGDYCYSIGSANEYRLRKVDGNYCWILLRCKVVEVGIDKHGQRYASRIVGTHSDISQQKEYIARLQELTSYDELTGLPNRKLFLQMVDKSLSTARRFKRTIAVLLVNLDRFRNVIESLGHDAGDKVLMKMAVRLKDVARSEDTVSRLEGDDFAILLDELGSPSQATELALRIIESQKVPFVIHGHEIVIATSIGIALFPDHVHNGSSDELLNNANKAMTNAKQTGGQNYQFFSDDLNIQARSRLIMEENLRNGINNGEIIAYYQPKIHLSSGKISGLEALSRWRTDQGMQSPGSFIPIAERSGLIVPLGLCILRYAVRDTRESVDEDILEGRVAINLSPKQFHAQSLLSDIDRVLEETGLPTKYIELEITEEAVAADTNSAIDIMHQIKNRGITLAMDDFGTGYSSLSALKRFPMDVLKIDMSFIHDMENSDTNKNIVYTIIRLARNLNLESVAEGVTTLEQAEMLTSMGCDTMQGYLFSKPVAKTEIDRLFSQGKTFDLYA